jgi:hypothetical protein
MNQRSGVAPVGGGDARLGYHVYVERPSGQGETTSSYLQNLFVGPVASVWTVDEKRAEPSSSAALPVRGFRRFAETADGARPIARDAGGGELLQGVVAAPLLADEGASPDAATIYKKLRAQDPLLLASIWRSLVRTLTSAAKAAGIDARTDFTFKGTLEMGSELLLRCEVHKKLLTVHFGGLGEKPTTLPWPSWSDPWPPSDHRALAEAVVAALLHGEACGELYGAAAAPVKIPASLVLAFVDLRSNNDNWRQLATDAPRMRVSTAKARSAHGVFRMLKAVSTGFRPAAAAADVPKSVEGVTGALRHVYGLGSLPCDAVATEQALFRLQQAGVYRVMVEHFAKRGITTTGYAPHVKLRPEGIEACACPRGFSADEPHPDDPKPVGICTTVSSAWDASRRRFAPMRLVESKTCPA